MSSRLGDIENAIIDRLRGSLPGTDIEFASLAAYGGGNRPAMRAAIQRLQAPAALVGFVDEARGPETRELVRGARFSVFVADRSLRLNENASSGGTGTNGTYALVDVVAGRLANYSLGNGLRLIETQIRFIESDERTAIHEIAYRAWPIREAPTQTLTFDGDAIVGPLSRMSLEIDPIRFVRIENTSGGADTFSIVPREIRWVGEIEAISNSVLNSLEENIETLVVDRNLADIEDDAGRTLTGCLIEQYERDGPRLTIGNNVGQVATIQFTQLNPEP